MQQTISRFWPCARYAALVMIGLVGFSTSLYAADRDLVLPVASVGATYSYTFMADMGFSEPYTWQISTSTVGDVLPRGLFVTGSGGRGLLLSGTPTMVGMYQFTIAPFSSTGVALPTTLAKLEVRAVSMAPRIVSGSGSHLGTVGVPFSTEPIVWLEYGAMPSRWRMVGGGLHPGLRFTEQGAIEGAAREAGTFRLEAQVEDANGFVAATSIVLTVNTVESSSSIPLSPPVLSPPSTGPSPAPTPISPPAYAPTNLPPASPPSSLSVSDRWAILNRLGIGVNTVVQSVEIDPLMLRPAHYYIGTDGRRHAFQTDAVYYSWYPTLTQNVRTLPMADIATMPLGEMVTYHPGERVRFRTDGQTYAVAESKMIYRLPTDSQTMTNWTWERGIEELDETHRAAYCASENFASPSMYDPMTLRTRYPTPNTTLSAS